MPKAEILQRVRQEFDDGAMLEMVIWRLRSPVAGSTHLYKYRLYYGKKGRRIVGYDNERTKGDHRHADGGEQLYRFVSIEKLVADFLSDVATRRQA